MLFFFIECYYCKALSTLFSHNLYCFVFISVYFMLLLAVLVTICPSAFNKFGLVWYSRRFRRQSPNWVTRPIVAENGDCHRIPNSATVASVCSIVLYSVIPLLTSFAKDVA